MHEQSHHAGPPPSGEQRQLAGPRLELPRFRLAGAAAPVATVPGRPAFTTAMHAPAPVPVPAQSPPPGWASTATAMRHPVAVTYAAPPAAAPSPPASAPTCAAPVPPSRRLPPSEPRASTTSHAATTVCWDRLAPVAAEPTLLQRITPIHMGLVLVMAMVAMVVTSGPAAMTATPTRLPALADGGGQGVAMLSPRAGTTALEAAGAPSARRAAAAKAKGGRAIATPATAPAARARARARARTKRAARAYIVVGNAQVKRSVRSGGIPSPAASANLAIAGGGRAAAGSTGSVRLAGIPSTAAAEKLGPQTLPYRPDDGVTLPRSAGERDSHSVDSHYGADTLPMEQAVELPAMTPGAAAARAEHHVARNELTHGSTPAPNVAGGLILAH